MTRLEIMSDFISFFLFLVICFCFFWNVMFLRRGHYQEEKHSAHKYIHSAMKCFFLICLFVCINLSKSKVSGARSTHNSSSVTSMLNTQGAKKWYSRRPFCSLAPFCIIIYSYILIEHVCVGGFIKKNYILVSHVQLHTDHFCISDPSSTRDGI